MKTSNWRRSLITILILFAASFPVTGFIYGIFACTDCGGGARGAIGRTFIGFVEAILTTITLGAPWNNEAGNSSTNLRFYVLITFICFLSLSLISRLVRKRRQKMR